jgi:hypothetical protein
MRRMLSLTFCTEDLNIFPRYKKTQLLPKIDIMLVFYLPNLIFIPLLTSYAFHISIKVYPPQRIAVVVLLLKLLPVPGLSVLQHHNGGGRLRSG